jgi:hypothetical protein
MVTRNCNRQLNRGVDVAGDGPVRSGGGRAGSLVQEIVGNDWREM